MTPDELRSRLTITVEEAADALGLGRSATYEAVRRGELPSLRFGRRVLIPTGPFRALLGDDGRLPPEDSDDLEDESPPTGRWEPESRRRSQDSDSGARVMELR